MVVEHHEIDVEHIDRLTEGENTFTCKVCNNPIVLIWDGTSFSLTEEEATDPTFGEVKIHYV